MNGGGVNVKSMIWISLTLGTIAVTGGWMAVREAGSHTPEGEAQLQALRRVLGTPVSAPEFVGEVGDWFNSPPLHMADLKGKKVVLVDFWEYTCVNCIRTLPYVKEWHRRYKDMGLVIVGVHSPEFEFAREHDNVRQAIEDFGIEYPVLVDSKYENWRAYDNHYWPRKYLINKDRKIIYDHAGEGGYGETERRIQEALRELNPRLKFPPIMEPVRGADKPGTVHYPVTREMYAGVRGFSAGQFGHPEKYEVGKTAAFNIPAEVEDGRLYLQGRWLMEREYLQVVPGDLKSAADLLTIRYHAKECNAVIKPQGETCFKVLVLQDREYVRKDDAGRDILFDGDKSYLLIDKPRMYSITVNKDYGEHILTLIPRSRSFAIYAFTFSSCEKPIDDRRQSSVPSRPLRTALSRSWRVSPGPRTHSLYPALGPALPRSNSLSSVPPVCAGRE